MQRLVLASHGYLAEGMKNSAQIIRGEVREDIYYMCICQGRNNTRKPD